VLSKVLLAKMADVPILSKLSDIALFAGAAMLRPFNY